MTGGLFAFAGGRRDGEDGACVGAGVGVGATTGLDDVPMAGAVVEGTAGASADAVAEMATAATVAVGRVDRVAVGAVFAGGALDDGAGCAADGDVDDDRNSPSPPKLNRAPKANKPPRRTS